MRAEQKLYQRLFCNNNSLSALSAIVNLTSLTLYTYKYSIFMVLFPRPSLPLVSCGSIHPYSSFIARTANHCCFFSLDFFFKHLKLVSDIGSALKHQRCAKYGNFDVRAHSTKMLVGQNEWKRFTYSLFALSHSKTTMKTRSCFSHHLAIYYTFEIPAIKGCTALETVCVRAAQRTINNQNTHGLQQIVYLMKKTAATTTTGNFTEPAHSPIIINRWWN